MYCVLDTTMQWLMIERRPAQSGTSSAGTLLSYWYTSISRQETQVGLAVVFTRT